MRTVRPGLLIPLILAVLAASGAAENLAKDVLLYAPFDGHLDVVTGAGGLLPADFRRDGMAWTPDLKPAEDNQPRCVPGRFGKAIFLESGDYGQFDRGTRNVLPPASSAAAGFPKGFRVLGGAACALDPATPALVCKTALTVRCDRAGQGIATMEARLPRIMRYIASVYLKGAKGGERVDLVLRDATNDEEKRAALTLTDKWARYQVVLPYPQWENTYGIKILEAPARAVVQVVARGPAVFCADAFMLEEAGIHYSNRWTCSTWVLGGEARGSEILNLPLNRDTYNPTEGTIAFWVKLEPGRLIRTLFALGSGWNTPVTLGVHPPGTLRFGYWGALATCAPPAPGRWQHVAIVWRGPDAAVYLNGSELMQAHAKDFRPADLLEKNAFLMPGNSDGGTSFSAKTHASGALDEFYVFRRALSPAELSAFVARKTPLVAPAGVLPRLDSPCHAFGREVNAAPVRFVLRNFAATDAKAVRATFSIGTLHRQAAPPVDVPAGGTTTLHYDFPAGALSPGTYPVRVEAGGNAATFRLEAGPYRGPDRLPVLAWNTHGATLEQMRELARIGITVAGTGFWPKYVDMATECGLFSHTMMHVRGTPDPGNRNDRILTNADLRDGPNPASPHIRQTAARAAAAYARKLADYPSVRYVIINTEWTPPMDFGTASRERAKRRFGLDLTKWMSDEEHAWALLHPMNRIRPTVLGNDWFPPSGVVAPDNPFYNYHLWFHLGGGNEVAINEICAQALQQTRPDVVRIVEPILRAPPLKRYHDADVAEEWYYYENPRVTIPVQERLACVCRGRPLRPSGMPQFLLKPGGAAPYAATPPPDMLREVLWLCASRPLCMMTFWGWHRVLSGDKMMTQAQIEKTFGGLSWADALARAKKLGGEGGGLFIPEVKDEVERFSMHVWRPFGPLLKTWRNRPRRIAVVISFADHLYNDTRWPRMGWLGDALTASGLPYDVLYDQSFTENPKALEHYRVVVLPNVAALPLAAFNQLKRFITAGGLVVTDENCKVRGIDGMTVFIEDKAADALKLITTRAHLPVVCLTPGILWNILELDGATYLVCVNDKREFGPYLGKWKKVREKGVPQDARFQLNVSAGLAWFDLVESKPVPHLRNDGWLTLNTRLGPTEGRIFIGLPASPARLSVQPEHATVARGAAQSLLVALDTTDGPAAGAFPMEIAIVEPGGRIHDRSCTGLIRRGRYRLDMIVPLNAETGVWKVKVRERTQGTTAATEFTVK